jgi:hypothetical protein
MILKHKILFTALLLCFLFVGMAHTAHAYTFYLDRFTLTKNGTVIFDDTFSGGNPPPSGPDFQGGGTTPSPVYYVTGTMGPESGGKLTLDSSGGFPSKSASGRQSAIQTAILNTNTDPSNLVFGLKSNHTFSITGTFDLILPSVPGEGYGVVFYDGAPSHTATDYVYVEVFMTSTNGPVVQFGHQDFAAGTSTVIGQIPLELNHDQIGLHLDKYDMNSNVVTGSFAYIDKGVRGPIHMFSNTITIFNTVNFTRAEFIAFTPLGGPDALLPVADATRTHYNVSGYSGSSIELKFVDPILSVGIVTWPRGVEHGQIDGLYPSYPTTIAATRDGAGKQVTLGRVGIDGGFGNVWIWDAACSATCPGGMYTGQLLPAWDGNVNDVSTQSFQIIPVPHDGWAHSRFPTSGYTLLPTDRPQTPDRSCMDIAPSSFTWDAGCIGPCTRTQATCSDVMQGAGLTRVIVMPGGGRFTIETFGDITPPVTFYIQVPYEKPDPFGCSTGGGCRTLYPPVWASFVFTVTN